MDLHRHHKKHRNILYLLVFLLIVFQIMSFIFISAQFTKLDAKINSEIKRVEKSLTSHFTNLLQKYDDSYQQNFNQLSLAVSEQASQQKSFEEQIKLLESSEQDFSEVIEDAIKGVVAVTTESSMGSGFILSSDGYLVTNYHVIQRGDKLRVLTYDRRIIPADLVGADKLRDLALLKMEGEYNHLKLADSDRLQVGKKVIAIGNPLGLSFTVTEGIVSALDREGPNGLEEYVQTDVSLNPGNSGGPLINTQGEAVGITNFKVGGAESLGFALESNAIKDSINSIAGKKIIT